MLKRFGFLMIIVFAIFLNGCNFLGTRDTTITETTVDVTTTEISTISSGDTVSTNTEWVTVSFDSDKGSEVGDIQILVGESIGCLPIPVREYYDFIGWYINDAKIEIDYIVIEQMELEARWEVRTDVNTIYSAEDLQNIENDMEATYILMNDIDLYGIDWIPIGYEDEFMGVFDGQNYTINNLTINNSDLFYVGLFGQSNGIIQNINLVDVNIDFVYAREYFEHGIYIGGIGGILSSCTNCYVDGEIKSTTGWNTYVGGIAGSCNTIYSSISHVDIQVLEGINDFGYFGGIAGYVLNVYDSKYQGEISTVSLPYSVYAGGIAGMTYYGEFDNCYVNVIFDIHTSKYIYVGGLVGLLDGDGDVSDNVIDIDAVLVSDESGVTAGGLVGKILRNESLHTNNEVSGSIQVYENSNYAYDSSNYSDSNYSFIGGVYGLISDTDIEITNSTSNVDIIYSAMNEYSNVGGFVGGVMPIGNQISEIYIHDNKSESNLTVELIETNFGFVGGFIGWVSGNNANILITENMTSSIIEINTSRPTDSIWNKLYIGGFFGAASCVSTKQNDIVSDIFGSGEARVVSMGGFSGTLGYNDSNYDYHTITENCFTETEITLDDLIAEFVYLGGFVGYNTSYVKNSESVIHLIFNTEIENLYLGGFAGINTYDNPLELQLKARLENCITEFDIVETISSSNTNLHFGNITGYSDGTIIYCNYSDLSLKSLLDGYNYVTYDERSLSETELDIGFNNNIEVDYLEFPKENNLIIYDSLIENDDLKEKSFYMQLLFISNSFSRNSGDMYIFESEYCLIGSIEYKKYGLTYDRAVEIYELFKNDNVSFYWLSSAVFPSWQFYCYEEERHEFINIAIDVDYKDYVIRSEFNLEIDNAINEVAILLDNTYDEVEIVNIIHEYIIEKSFYLYENDNITPSTQKYAHNIIGALNGVGSVCDGYSKSLHLLLNYNGIKSLTVGSSSMDHMWNVVQVYEIWYWMDITWNDSTGTSNWFLLGNASFYKDHTQINDFYILPETSETDYMETDYM
jgi:hypothetical protein